MATNQPKWCQVLGINLPAFQRRTPSAASQDPNVNVGAGPTAVAFTPNGSAAYVTDSGDSSFNVITNTPPYLSTEYAVVGANPFWVAITPTPPVGAPSAYITNTQDSTVSVVDTATNTVSATIDLLPGGSSPLGVAITPDGSQAFVATPGTTNVSVIDTATNTVTGTIALPALSAPFGVATSPTAPLALVTDSGTNEVSVINTATATLIGAIAVGVAPFGLAVAPNGLRAYVANSGEGTVSVIDLSPALPGPYPVTTTITMPGAVTLTGVAVAPDSGHVYVTDQSTTSVYVINAAANLVVATITAQEGPFGAAVTPDSANLYVANNISDTVTITAAAPFPTTTGVTSGPEPTAFGEPKTLTATVTPDAPVTGTPTGTVQFYDNNVPLGAAQTLPASGSVSLTVSDLAVGAHPITAQYSGDANFQGSTTLDADVQTVEQGKTSVQVTSGPEPSAFGEPKTLTATVAVTAGVGTPTGTVQFYDNNVPLGAAQTLPASGSVSLTVSDLAVGAHPITAQYSGDANFQGSTLLDADVQTVKQGATMTTLTSEPSPSTVGQTVTLTATVAVTAGVGTPTGTVQFYDGQTLLGQQQLGASGVAVLQVSTLAAGTHTLTAKYSGDTDFGSSEGSTQQVVNAAAPTPTALTAAPAVATIGSDRMAHATLSATLTTQAGAPISGQTITFRVSGLLVGTATTGGDGIATANATIDPRALLLSGSRYTASFAGTADYLASSGSAPLVLA